MPELPTSVVARLRARRGLAEGVICTEAANAIEALVGALRHARNEIAGLDRAGIGFSCLLATIDEALALTSIDKASCEHELARMPVPGNRYKCGKCGAEADVGLTSIDRGIG